VEPLSTKDGGEESGWVIRTAWPTAQRADFLDAMFVVHGS